MSILIGTCCVGHTHPIVGDITHCRGGGNCHLLQSDERESDEGSKKKKKVRATQWQTVGQERTQLRDCPASTIFVSPSDLLVPRRLVKRSFTLKETSYARVELMRSTRVLVCTVQPENMANLHPHQDRTLTIREYARLQVCTKSSDPAVHANGSVLPGLAEMPRARLAFNSLPCLSSIQQIFSLYSPT